MKFLLTALLIANASHAMMNNISYDENDLPPLLISWGTGHYNDANDEVIIETFQNAMNVGGTSHAKALYDILECEKFILTPELLSNLITTANINYDNNPDYGVHIARVLLNYGAENYDNVNVNLSHNLVNELVNLSNQYLVYLPHNNIQAIQQDQHADPEEENLFA